MPEPPTTLRFLGATRTVTGSGAEVVARDGFSAHADANNLVAWLSSGTEPQTSYVVHGDETPARTLAARITKELGWCAVVPRHDERVLIRPQRKTS